MSLEFESLEEAEPGPKWRQRFESTWPDYRRWFLREGEAKRPTYRASLRALKRHMPEILPSYERMVELAGGGDFAARFLTQFCPPPFFAACSQAVFVSTEPVLIRNYDYSPLLCDGLVLQSAWNRRRIIGMADCMAGLLDGMNDDGLAVSLAFGGRRDVGEGFGVTLVLRYVLETCGTVSEAVRALRRVPVQVAYNIALLDRDSNHATVKLAPDREAVVTDERASTNHQGAERWHEYTKMIASEERLSYLDGIVDGDCSNPEILLKRFLQPPLFRDSYALGYGTLFTSVYLPARGEIWYCWLKKKWRFAFGAFRELKQRIIYRDPGARAGDRPAWPQLPPRKARVLPGIINR